MTVSVLGRRYYLSVHPLVPTLAFSALVSTVLLILMGSIVRVTGNGLGCPDWPLCHGQAIPPALTGAWVEFIHRLIGAAASLQIILLALFVTRSSYRNRPWVFWPAVAAVGLLVVQIVLGGVHVIYELPAVTGWVHTGVALLIVGLLAIPVAGTLPAAQRLRSASILRERRFMAWLSGTAGATYLLLLTGSYVTRSGASLACPSFPLCGSPAPAMRWLIDIQMLHRYMAYSAAFLILVTLFWMLRKQKNRELRLFAYGVGTLLVVQFGLGISNVLLRLPVWSRALHLTVAATLWAGLVFLWSLCASGPESASV